MSEWATQRLGDLAVVVDCEHKTAPPAATGTEYGYSVGTPHIRGGRIDYGAAKRVTKETFDAWSRRAVLGKGDLILAREAPVGQVGRVDPERPTCLGQRTVLVRPLHDNIEDRYLHAYLLGHEAQRWMEDRSSGSTVAHLNVADVREIPVRVPPLDEQRRIAAVLGAFDDLIETNLWSWARVRDISGAMYAEALQRAEGEQTLGSVSRVSESKTKPGVGGIRYVDIAAMGDGHIEIPDAIDWEDAPSRARMLATDGATLWSTVRPNRRAHGLLVESPDDLVVSTGIAVIEPDGVGPAELFAACDRPEFVDHLLARASGSAYPAVRSSDFRTVPIARLRPEDSEQFESVSWPLWKDAHAGLLDNERLTRARDELLPLLMSGRVRVDDVEGMV